MNLDSKVAPVLSHKAASVADTGTLVSDWVDAASYSRIHAVVGKDAGDGAYALTWEQATASAGTSAKALSGYAGTEANARTEVSVDSSALDINNRFRWVRATATVTGGTGTLMSLTLFGFNPRYSP